MRSHFFLDTRYAKSAETPVVDRSHTTTGTLVWSENVGWISWQPSGGRRPKLLCWLPVERRGEAFVSYGTTAAIGARQGAVTILDFSDVIALLNSLD
jgi:hypothetical protein